MRFFWLMASVGALALLRVPAGARDGYGEPALLSYLQDARVKESSGIAASRRTPGLLWTHNDSGDGPNLYAFDRKGRALARFSVPGLTSVDWEDIAIGPGEGDNATLYIGDIGDNASRRKDAAVYRIWEPAVDMSKTRQDGHTMLAERFPFAYPDGPRDAETLLVNPVTGDIFIVAKTDTGQSGVYQFPMPLTRNRTATLNKIATLTFNNPLAFGRRAVGKLATGGAFSPDGRKLVIRTYTDAFEWQIKPGQSVGEALSQPPRRIAVPFLGQFEGICYRHDGKALLTTCEGAPCPLWELPAK